MITFKIDQVRVSLPSPVFNDTVNTNKTVLIKRFMSKSINTYLKGADKKDFVLTFSGVSRLNYEAFKVFYKKYSSKQIIYTDLDGVNHTVKLLTDGLVSNMNSKGTLINFSITCQEI